MSNTTFVDKSTVIEADWLQDLNNLRYGVGNTAKGAALLQFIQAGTGASTRDMQAKAREFVSVRDFGAVGDGVANDTAAITAAIASVTGAYGAVYIPPGHYKITAALPAPYGVSVFGAGGLASVIECYDCDGFSSTAGVAWDQNMSVHRDYGLRAMSGTNRTGFRVATSPYSGEQDGYHLLRLRLFEWDTAIYGGSLWQSNIENCWIEQVNTGIRLDGHAVLINVLKNQIIHTGGGRGSAANIGVQFGSTDIEANVLQDNFIYGFIKCVVLGEPWHCTVKDNILFANGPEGAALVGIDITTVKEHLNVCGNMVECASTATGSWVGIIGRPTFTSSNAQLIIENNRVWDDTGLAAGTIGIQINDVGNTNQNNVVIAKNNLLGHSLYDIAVYNPNNVVVENNDCRSAGVTTYNLLLYGTVTGPCVGRQNRCIKTIYAEAAYLDSGQIILDSNTINNAFQGMRNSAVYNPPNLADGTGTSTTVTVTGAALGDWAQASFSLDVQGVMMRADVTSANTVTVRFQNESGGAVDLGSGTLRVRVIRAGV